MLICLGIDWAQEEMDGNSPAIRESCLSYREDEDRGQKRSPFFSPGTRWLPSFQPEARADEKLTEEMIENAEMSIVGGTDDSASLLGVTLRLFPLPYSTHKTTRGNCGSLI